MDHSSHLMLHLAQVVKAEVKIIFYDIKICALKNLMKFKLFAKKKSIKWLIVTTNSRILRF